MGPTRIRVLVVVAVVGVVAGYLLARVLDGFTSTGLPQMSPVTPALFVLLAAGLLVAARVVNGWVKERRYDRRMDALTVARLLALAKAAAVFGAFALGGYAGFGMVALDLMDSDAGQRRVLLVAATCVGALATTVAALRLERACRVPPTDDERGLPPQPWDDGATRPD